MCIQRLRTDPTLERAARAQWVKGCRSMPLQGSGATANLPVLWLEFKPVRAIAAQVGVTFNLDVTLNREHAITNVFSGELFASHAAGCVFARATAMAEVALERMPAPSAALVVTRHGHATKKIAARTDVELIEAGHPYPDAESIHAAERALDIAHRLEAQDHLLVLLSGGGSALLAAPASGLNLSDKQATTRALLTRTKCA